MLLEQLLLLLEKPLPDDLEDHDIDEPDDLLQAATDSYTKLGKGSSRVTFETGGEKTRSGKDSPRKLATKIVHKDGYPIEAGRAQTEAESKKNLKKYMEVRKRGDIRILAPIVDYDKKNFNWIQFRKAKKYNHNEFIKYMGTYLNNFYDAIEHLTINQKLFGGIKDDPTFKNVDIDVLEDYLMNNLGRYRISKDYGLNRRGAKFIVEIVKLAQEFDLDVMDLATSDNWGMYKGKPVIIDFGFTKDVGRRFY